MRFTLLLALTGCGFQITGNTSGDDIVPIDAIDGPVIDAPMVDGDSGPLPPEDSDGDGVVDADDNCVATMNADQRDHDGDAFGDACDRCPHLASSTDPDGDGDGVGDDCDPRPQNSADRRVIWAPFDDPAATAAWTGQGLWMVSGGYLRQTSANQTGQGPVLTVNVPFVMAEVVIDNVINTNADIGLAVQKSSGTRFECAISKNGSNVSARGRVFGGTSQSQAWAGTFTTNTRIRYTMNMTSDVDCTFREGNTSTQVVAATTITPEGGVFVGMVGAAARFDYLFIVDEDPP